jgi:hypothetical protein
MSINLTKQAIESGLAKHPTFNIVQYLREQGLTVGPSEVNQARLRLSSMKFRHNTIARKHDGEYKNIMSYFNALPENDFANYTQKLEKTMRKRKRENNGKRRAAAAKKIQSAARYRSFRSKLSALSNADFNNYLRSFRNVNPGSAR